MNADLGPRLHGRPAHPLICAQDLPGAARKRIPTTRTDASCHTLRPVTSKRLGIAAAVLVVDTAVLLIVGHAMWSDPSSSADEAVGKGLLALGAVFGIPAFVLFCAFLDSMARLAPVQDPEWSDREPV